MVRASPSLVLVLGLPDELVSSAGGDENHLLDVLSQLEVQTSVGRFRMVQEAAANCCDLQAKTVQIHLAGCNLPPGRHQITVCGLQPEPLVLEVVIPEVPRTRAAA